MTRRRHFVTLGSSLAACSALALATAVAVLAEDSAAATPTVAQAAAAAPDQTMPGTVPEVLPPGETPVPIATPADEPPPAPVTQAVVAPVPVNDPVLVAVREALSKSGSGIAKADLDAMVAFYATRTEGPVWIKAGGLTPAAQQVAAALKSADDWGLDAKAFALPELTPGANPDAQAAAEVTLTASALKYAHQASGGRVDPASLSRFNDERGTFADPAQVLVKLAASGKPEAVLEGFHPQHLQFQRLHAALVKLRHGDEPKAEVAAVAPGMAKLELASGPALKPGAEHADIAAVRAYLGVTAVPGQEATYDDALVSAVKGFQRDHGLKPSGVLSGGTRTAFNSASAGGAAPRKAEGKPRLKQDDIERIVLNMERWRWMPADMGAFHIENNIPEFTTRVFDDGKIVHQEKIIVGKTDTPTSIFSANMQFVIFHPEWGVPDSIKMKEILPSLRRKTSSDDFFGFGSTVSDTRVLQRHNLRVSYNGHPVDASQIDWTTANVRAYSFIQPAGGQNVLGVVKFRFPNRHDIYMHDTPQRELFNDTTRAFSHGCMRVHNPQRLAEVILAHDRGWSAEKVAGMIAGSSTNEVKIEKQFPVHVMYITARVEDDGKLVTFADLYGHDSKLAAALAGRPVRLEDPAAVSTSEGFTPASGPAGRPLQKMAKKGKQSDNPDTGLGGLLSGLFGN